MAGQRYHQVPPNQGERDGVARLHLSLRLSRRNSRLVIATSRSRAHVDTSDSGVVVSACNGWLS